jgi:hypothetical protein
VGVGEILLMESGKGPGLHTASKKRSVRPTRSPFKGTGRHGEETAQLVPRRYMEAFLTSPTKMEAPDQ